MASTQPWHTHFPTPTAVAEEIDCEELMNWMQTAPNSFVVVDVRRNDFAGYKVTDSVNIPAQSFPMSLDVWSEIFGSRKVVFHCSSSKGRGPRSAAAYQDYLNSSKKPGQAFVLRGGIKAWQERYPEAVQPIPDLS